MIAQNTVMLGKEQFVEGHIRIANTSLYIREAR